MMATVFIYGLFHQDRCVYVGRTADPTKRMQTHAPRFEIELGAKPVMRILQKVSPDLAVQAEEKAILEYRRLGQAEFNKFPLRDKRPLNLSIRADVARAVTVFCALEGITVSQLTETLWITYLRRKGVKLPESVLLKA